MLEIDSFFSFLKRERNNDKYYYYCYYYSIHTDFDLGAAADGAIGIALAPPLATTSVAYC